MTVPEKIVASMLQAFGARYVAQARGLPGTPDFVVMSDGVAPNGTFLRDDEKGVAIFVHGCLWHGHDHAPIFAGVFPKRQKNESWAKYSRRRTYWHDKIARNKQRDARVARKLRRMGWRVITLWECDILRLRVADKLRRALFPEPAKIESSPIRVGQSPETEPKHSSYLA